MRQTNRKLVLGLFVAALSLCLGLVSPHHTYAAGTLKGGTALIDPNGNTIQLSNAKFLDPFTIAVGNVTYRSDMTACDGDHIYNCGDGDVFHSGSYWYWPTSDGSPSKSQISGGKCASAIVLSIRQTPGGTGLNGSYIYAVSAKAGLNTTGNNGGCMVPDDSGNAIKDQDITGWGARAEYADDYYVTKNAVDTHVDPNHVGRLTVDKGMGFALGTEFKWVNKNEIDSVMGGGSGPSLRKSMLVTNADTIKTIQTALAHDDSSTKPLASGYSYYIPTECINSKQQIVAMLAVSTSDPSQATIVHRLDGDASRAYRADSWQGDQQDCLYGKNHWNSPNRVWGGGRTNPFIGLADVKNATADPGDTSGGNGGGDTGGTNDAQLDCGGGILNWIICPFITLAQGAAQKLDGYISEMLTADINSTFSDAYYNAWNSFRILGTAVIIIAGLIMVVSQALGFEILDAYTIRKTMPRLLIAIIGMSLSWPLLKFVVGFFNTIGSDIYGLIVGPFGGLDAKVNPGIGILSTLLVPAAGAAALFAFGPAALLMIVSGLLGLLMAFLILLIRQIAISAIIILAPIAIACYVLPNTQKVWKLWHENFIGLMMMFPIVMAFIAAGHAFATVSLHNGGSVSQIIGIVAYFIPYFLLPLAFRLATGVISTISGMVNDRSKGAFDRMRNVRTNAAKDRHQRRMNEQLSNNRIGNIYRRVGSAAVPGSGALGFTRQSRANYSAYRQAHMQHVAAEALKNDGGRAAGDDVATAVAVRHGTNRSNFVANYMDEARRQGMDMSRVTENDARNAMALLERGFGAQMGTEAMQVAAYKARAGSSTAYNSNPIGDETYEEAANRATMQRINEGAALVAQGAMTSADAVAAGKGNRARLDISGRGFGAQIGAFENAAQSIRNGGTGMTADGVDGIQNAEGARQYIDNTLQEAEPGDMLAGNTRTLSTMAPAMMRNLNRAVQAHNEAVANGESDQTILYRKQAVDRALGQIAGVQDNLNRTSPQKAGMFADMVNAQAMQVQTAQGVQQTTVREMVSEAANRAAGPNGIQTFLEVRKEYGAAGRGGYIADAEEAERQRQAAQNNGGQP